MLSLNLAPDLQARLNDLSEKTGRSPSFYIQVALMAQLEELEDLYLSEQALDNLKKGQDTLVDHSEFWRDLEN